MSRFKELYKADLKRYGGNIGIYLRIFHYFYRKVQTENIKPLKLLFKILFRLWASIRGIEISENQFIGGGMYLGHAYNITVNPKAIIGKNCNLHKGVVIGQVNRGRRLGAPKIGNRVWIGINSAIVGNVIIGDDVLIAPNSYVNIDIPAHSVVLGNPCIIKHRDNATEGYVTNVIE